MTACNPSATDLRRALSCFVTGVTIVTTCDRLGAPVGLTVNSFSSVSLKPPLVLWSLRSESRSLPVFEAAGHFAVNVLSRAQKEQSALFASGAVADKFDKTAYFAGIAGMPLLHGCLATLECETETTHRSGDHVIFIGRVLRCALNGEHDPLIFFRGRYLEQLTAS